MRIELLREILDIRRWFCPYGNNDLDRLSNIESKIANFFDTSALDERKWLMTVLSENRYQWVTNQILASSTPPELQNREAIRSQLCRLLEVLKTDDYEKIKSVFLELPPDVRGHFYWAVWMYCGAPYGHRLGEKILHANISLLREIQTPILHLHGNTLVEQALHYYEMLLAIEKQKNRVGFLEASPASGDLNAEKSRLLHLEQLKDLEEFECIVSGYKESNPAQRRGFLERASAKVRAWVEESQWLENRRERLFSDSRHLYLWRGAHFQAIGTKFQVFAPHARSMNLVLTYGGRIEHCLPMERNRFGIWETFSHDAQPGRTYRYQIEDCHGHWSYRTDPFGSAVMEQNGTMESVVIDENAYQWNDHHWMQTRACSDPLKKPLSIYELHVDSWKKHHGRTLTWGELAQEIVNYHREVPFTHVMLYGVLDNKNDYSWGFQVDHFLAPNSRLGHPDGLKYFVDLCHQNGIGVSLVLPFAHFKADHNGDRSRSLHEFDGCNHVAAEPSPWGTLHFDFAKEEAWRLIFSSFLHWVENMHMDGFLLDYVATIERHGHLDQAAASLLREVNKALHEQYPGILTFAEYTGGMTNVTKPVHEGGLGFDAKLGVHQQWKARNYWRTPYEERKYHHDKLKSILHDVQQEERILVSHTHDDAAEGAFHNLSTVYSSIPTGDPWRKFADLRLWNAWNLLLPSYGGHLIHMGDEIGQRWPWNHRLNDLEGAVEWHLLNDPQEGHFHLGVKECVGDLNRLYLSKPAFWKLGAGSYRPISDCAETNVIGFQRLDDEGGRLALFFNFSSVGYKGYNFPMPPVSVDLDLARIKEAREIFNSDGQQYGGTGNFPNEWAYIVRDAAGTPTHFRIALPPLSVLVFDVRLWDKG